ncbi:pectate lyase family protein [Nonomuraea dietziae]|uniref:Pectate lyase n=1 Tax=Nonomuraea dietziae TaxID=65515 RepID=A0A7W5VHA9_9ACTN|nr:polysaccharide lyase family 1 protein [Nonomuraea dietziae]MBB3731440.1 pectate lyase [Nonomuraea dietziae]
MRRTLTLITALACALAVAPPAHAVPPLPDPDRPIGWGEHATGGAGGPVHVVTTRKELKDALATGGPKTIHVRGTIYGNQTDDGVLLGEQDYAPGYDLGKYLACFVGGKVWSDQAHAWCGQMRRLRQTGSNNQKRQIQLTVPSDTTLLGIGADARLEGVFLSVNTGSNIIVRGLELESPIDHFTSWDPGDGESGSWNARFKAFGIVTGSRIWIDHCAFTDGQRLDRDAPTGPNGKPVNRHDGLLDIEDGSDLITVSYNRFVNHDKNMLVGSGDGRGDRDRGKLRVTYYGNLFDGVSQRSPRVRYGAVHVFNNYYRGSMTGEQPLVSNDLGGPSHYLGLGIESRVYSEHNAFEYDGPQDIVVQNWNAHRFFDRRSWFNGRPVDVVAVARRKFEAAKAAELAKAAAAGSAPPAWTALEFTTDVGWAPAEVYAYRPLVNANLVKRTVLEHAGPAALDLPAPG